MAMPTPSKTYYALANKALADVSTVANAANSYLHAFLKTLKGQNHGTYTAGPTGAPPASSYWTVTLSSNGTTASAADNFNNTYTAGEWLSNTAGNAHSWFVLQSPASPGIVDGPWYILIAKDSATTTSWTFAISKTAWTGGTTTANPTNAGTISSTGVLAHFNTAGNAAGKTHFLVDAKGNFFFFGSRDASQVVETWDIFTELEQTQPSGDAFRAVGYSGHATSGLWNNINNGTNISSANLTGFHRNGVAASSNLVLAATNLASFTELNGINSDVEIVKYGLIYSTLTGNMAIRGYIPDIYQATTAPTNGSNNPNPATPVWSAIGSTTTGGKVAIPFGGTMAL